MDILVILAKTHSGIESRLKERQVGKSTKADIAAIAASKTELVSPETAVAVLQGGMDERKIKFIQVYLATGSAINAYKECYADLLPASTDWYAAKAGYAILASPEVQDFLTTRKESAARLGLGNLPQAITQLTDIATDRTKEWGWKANLQAIDLLTKITGMQKVDDNKLQVLIQNISSMHPVGS